MAPSWRRSPLPPPPLLLLLLPLLPLLPQAAPGGEETDHCCLPVKWYGRMRHTEARQARSLLTGQRRTEPEKTLELEAFVNYRRPKFELRAKSGSSHVFWRGHMWRFYNDGDGRRPEMLNAVVDGFRPSGGYAPFFFRCLAPEFGFRRLNATHYRLSEPSAGARFGQGTVTDIFVRPLARAASRRGYRHTCLLTGFNVVSRYAQALDDLGPALVDASDTWRTVDGGSRPGWPDRRLTQRTRASLRVYRNLLRSGALSRNRPHLALPALPLGESIGQL